ncbi:UNVERIFIED_CONTAM: hypothetical protein GTU68_003649 [Idotea baltica]|nr:hypothetical protein [Idotea baltica]
MVGFTANSFTSVSLEPPLLLVCPGKSLSSYSVFEECTHFAINVLADDQQDVSNLFAGFTGDRFAEIAWEEDAFGSPILAGATTHFSCSTHQRVDAGDHMVLMGEIQDFSSTGKEGLGYSNNGYFSLGLERGAGEAPATVRSFRVGAIIEADGKVLLRNTDDGFRLPTFEVQSRTGALAAIREHLSNSNLPVELGPVYSIFDNPKTGDYSVYFLASGQLSEPSEFGEYISLDSLTDITFATSSSLQYMLNLYTLDVKPAYLAYTLRS